MIFILRWGWKPRVGPHRWASSKFAPSLSLGHVALPAGGGPSERQALRPCTGPLPEASPTPERLVWAHGQDSRVRIQRPLGLRRPGASVTCQPRRLLVPDPIAAPGGGAGGPLRSPQERTRPGQASREKRRPWAGRPGTKQQLSSWECRVVSLLTS